METPVQTGEKFLSKVLSKEGISGVLLVMLIAQNFWLDWKRAEREERQQVADRKERAESQSAILSLAQLTATASSQAAEVARGYERAVKDNTRVMERVEWRLARGQAGTSAPAPAISGGGGG